MSSFVPERLALSDPSPSAAGLLAAPVATLFLAMAFVVALGALGHDPHTAVAEALALIAGVNLLGR